MTSTKNNMAFVACLILVACLSSGSMQSQNLVPNYSFETVVNCETGILLPGSTISDAEGWVSPNQASADHFNQCHTTFSLNLGEPVNFMGIQDPLTGESYAGVITWEDTALTSNYREYIQIQLSEPLEQDVEYSIGFHCSLAEEATFASDGLGMYLSVDQVTEPSQYIMDYDPQLVADVVTGEANWVQVSGSFTASGGESYVTLGSFTDDASTTLEETPGGFFVRSYYYVDDVYVIDSTMVVGLDDKVLDQLDVYPNPANDEITIALESSQQNVAIRISDLTGTEWLTQTSLVGPSAQIDISQLPAGIYFVEIRTQTEREVRRIVKRE
jgi:hypothetical protein